MNIALFLCVSLRSPRLNDKEFNRWPVGFITVLSEFAGNLRYITAPAHSRTAHAVGNLRG